MPQKLNKAGKMQDYIPAGNGDASGEYGTSNGTNKNFTASDKEKTQANVIKENKSVSKSNKKLTPREKIKEAIETDDIDLSNKLMDEATSELKFNSDEEREKFLDIVQSYRDPQEMFDYLDKVENKGNDVDSIKSTKALKIENMNEAQLDDEIEKAQKEIDRLEKVMGNNKMSDNLSKDFPLGVGGSGWSAERKKQFSQNIERDTIKAKNYTDAYKERESLKNRLEALNKAKEQVKGTSKTQTQMKKDAINNTQSTLNWEKGKIENPYGKGTINVIKANGYEIRSVDSGFFAIYKDGKSVGNTNKLKDAKAYVERRSQANIIK